MRSAKQSAPSPAEIAHAENSGKTPRLIALPEVLKITSLSKGSLYTMIARGEFPRQVVIGPATVRWSELAVSSWVQARIDASAGGEASLDAKRQALIAGARRAASASVASRRRVKAARPRLQPA